MKVKEQHLWFLGFTAVFAALAGFVFWGTWSLDVAPVMPDDTPDSLRRRVLEDAEWKLLSQAVSLYCANRLSIRGNRVIIEAETVK